ncbi:ninein, putative [Ixodes scapularis]|uniref:Ninein, putative n=1 Tax=Ixodes scapularis TaxID=6945 RepID=B7PU66_IXOSC|nr:ninein, putative [Ixodes scapularis]|eukprot:XP_002405573.1 ninein, putative [Ixodes scapularis]
MDGRRKHAGAKFARRKKEGMNKVSFDEFKDGFISLLTQAEEEALSNLSAPTTYVAVDVDDEMNGNSPDVARKAREVSPKYVLGEKKYGRRSRPASQADVDVEISSEEEFDGDDVLLSGTSDGNGNTATTREVSEEPGSKVKTACVSDGSGLEILAGAVPAAEHSTADVGGGDFGTACLPVPASDFVSDSGFRTPDESGKETPPPPAASFNAALELGSAPSPGQLGSVAVFGGGGSESAESSLTLLETNPEEYLRATWRKLNVGRNGYLQVQELAGVCEHIGMEMDEEMICQLFHTLDSDQDGKISFEEFLQGMFQHGRAPSSRGVSPPPPSAATPSSLPPDPSPPHMTALPSSRPVKDAGEDIAGHYRPHHTYRRGRSATGFSKDASAADDTMPEQPVTGAAAPVWESGIFSSIDPDNSGLDGEMKKAGSPRVSLDAMGRGLLSWIQVFKHGMGIEMTLRMTQKRAH